MTGGQKAAAIIALVVIAMIAFNWSLWRRLKAARAVRGEWSDADFDAMLVAGGVSPSVPPIVRRVVAHLYGAGVSPHPDDDFARFLTVDADEVEDIVAQAWAIADLPPPTVGQPERIPPMKDLRDLAAYLDARMAARMASGDGSR